MLKCSNVKILTKCLVNVLHVLLAKSRKAVYQKNIWKYEKYNRIYHASLSQSNNW